MYVILGGVADVLIDTRPAKISVAEMKKNDFGRDRILCDVRAPPPSRRASRSHAQDLQGHVLSHGRRVPQMAIEIMRELAPTAWRTPQGSCASDGEQGA